VAAVTANLDALARPSPVKQQLKRHDNQNWVAWDPEVGPVQVFVDPWWPPPLVEVQPEVRGYFAGIGIDAAKRHGGQLRAVWQHDTTAV
jgi:hypothetical protein